MGEQRPVEYPTGIGTSDADRIYLLGHDLAGELIGKVGFGELALWLATQQRPTPQQVCVFGQCIERFVGGDAVGPQSDVVIPGFGCGIDQGRRRQHQGRQLRQ